MWTCQHCETENADSSNCCKICGNKRALNIPGSDQPSSWKPTSHGNNDTLIDPPGDLEKKYYGENAHGPSNYQKTASKLPWIYVLIGCLVFGGVFFAIKKNISPAPSNLPLPSSSVSPDASDAVEQSTQNNRICNNTLLSDEDALRQIASFLLAVDSPAANSPINLSYVDCLNILRTMLVHTDAIIDTRVNYSRDFVSLPSEIADEYMQLLFQMPLPKQDDDCRIDPNRAADNEFGWAGDTLYFGRSQWNLDVFNYEDGEIVEMSTPTDNTHYVDVVFHPRYFLDTHVKMLVQPTLTDFRYNVIYFHTETYENDIDKFVAADEDDPIYIEALKYYEAGEYQDAFPLFLELAENDNASAQYYLGKIYENALVYDSAFYWYSRSAEHGNAFAQGFLGNCYRHGHGTDKDIGQAVYWYKKSADQNNGHGLINLGYCYQHGLGVARDIVEARRCSYQVVCT